ncbi:ribosomal L7Ae/L30e/S12e/Gadd45 family protein [uncultured Catenibacterium sp.]|uniref:L7Ae/L30e/S12e/Gadd45 family ribosomal protein n=1 Tax=uncultured Catenibacterium sp. TaxID=286142 RepID=UPI0025974BF6|nr:ribosomal L7Ae/L30e/S12e/Gadd45 family protein [uncultured Catenibacterium sp.]
MLNKQVASLLGLAMRARKLATGERALKSIQSDKAHLVLIASDASDNTKKKYIDKCTYYQVDYYIAGTSEELSNSVGKVNRMAIAVLDAGFAKSMKSKLGG